MTQTPIVKTRQILFVDDDQAFLETLSQLFLSWSQGAWQVHLATTTARALALLQDQPMDLAVMDIQMPVMDGLQFLALLNRKYPNLRKVVMTGFPNDEYRAGCLEQGAELFLEKPRSSEGYETLFATLNELATLQPQEGFRGVLRQVGLPDLIQLECLGRKSSILEVVHGPNRGRIYIEAGAIVHAEQGPFKGETAFNHLLCLRGGEFNHKPFSPPPEKSITGQWEFLLMEAARMRDELAELTPASPSDPGNPAAPATGPEPQNAGPAAPDASLPSAEEPATRINEMVVCSGRSEVLYEWQCRKLDSRLKLLKLVGGKAEQLSQLLGLGHFDRLEILEAQNRHVVQIAPDQKLFVSATRKPAVAQIEPIAA